MQYIISPVKSFKGTIYQLPPDKSISHRAAMFAALADGKSRIYNFSKALDPQSTVQCLRDLGVGIDVLPDDSLIINGAGRTNWKEPNHQLDCGNSGTTIRLLSGILAGAKLNCTISGDASIEKRPMNRVLDPLLEMGASIISKTGGLAPLEFKETDGLNSISYNLPMASAQVKSCVLLAGLFAEGETKIIESESSRDHTERMLNLPFEFLDNGNKVIKSNRNHIIPAFDFTVPGDVSAAAFWMVAGTIFENSEIILKNVGINPTRAAVISILKRMGANITLENLNDSQTEPTADILIHSANLKAVEIFANEIANAIDEFPVLAVAMTFADGSSSVRNASELRKKETDRIMAIVAMLKSSGVNIIEFEDGYEIEGNPDFIPEGLTYKTWHDHRIAMSSAILAAKSKNDSVILNSECASVSYPDFWKHFEVLTQK